MCCGITVGGVVSFSGEQFEKVSQSLELEQEEFKYLDRYQNANFT